MIGPKRVWDETGDGPGLAMSRCFGDTRAAKCGIISVPSVTKMEITSNEAIIVLGSDGLFEFLSNKEVIL